MKTVLTPKYYNDFQCIGPACEDSCCSNGFSIDLTKQNYDFMIYKSALKDKSKTVFQRTKKKNMYAEIKMVDGACPMLNEEKLCTIYIADGPERMPKTCQEYPRKESHRGMITEKNMALSCPEVVRKLCFDEHAMEMTQVVERSNQKKTKYARPLWFHDARHLMHDIMHIPNIKFEEKLYTVGLTLSELVKYSDGEPQVMGNALAACRETISQGLMHGMFQQQQPSSYHQAIFFCLFWDVLDKGLGGNKYNMRRTKILHSRISRVIKDAYFEHKNISERAEVYETYLQNTEALARYNAFMEKRPFVWSNYFLYIMWGQDFPKSDWQSFLSFVTSVFIYLRSALILLAHEGDLSDDDFVLVVQSTYMAFQNQIFSKLTGKIWRQFDDYMDFKLPDNGFSLTPLLLLKLPNHEDASTQMPLPEQTTPEQPTDSA